MSLKRPKQSDIKTFFKRVKFDNSVCSSTDSCSPSPLTSLPQPDLSSLQCDSARSSETESVRVLDIKYPRGDIALGLQAGVSRQLRLQLLTETWTPSFDYSFPFVKEANRNRRFQSQWLIRYPWLAYSPSMEGAFCKFCVLFGPEAIRNQSLKRLVTTPFTRYKDAIELFSGHESNKFHQNAVAQAEAFKNSCASGSEDISIAISSSHQRQVEENRMKIVPIIKTVMFCARNELPLRGHRDHGKLDVSNNVTNDGVFRSALRFRVDAGDTVLQNHLETAAANATYLSWETQNAIIDACGACVQKCIVEEVKRARFFSIIVDETTDASTREQSSISLRYVRNSTNIIERFFSFCDLQGDSTAKSISSNVTDILKTAGLDLSLLRGQSYDGASTMRGQYGGVQTLMKQYSPQAVYVHCSSHVLNLATNAACKVVSIRNAHGQIIETAKFFHFSAKRTTILQTNVTNSQDGGGKKLKTVCPTRWVEGHSAIIKFLQLLESIVATLDEISSTGEKYFYFCSVRQTIYINFVIYFLIRIILIIV